MMLTVSRNRFEDIKRTTTLSSALLSLDKRTFLFREAYSLGYPKFSDVSEIRPGQQMTAFVGTDHAGNFIFVWGRDFFDSLMDDTNWPTDSTSLSRVMFVLAHETLHVMLRHVTRAAGKVSEVWNWACDVVVNHFCDWYGLYVLPESCTVASFSPEWGIDPATQTTEEIYEILLKNAKCIPTFAPGTGHHDSWENLDERTRDILESHVIEASQKAAIKDEGEGKNDPDQGDVKGCGKLPGNSAMGELREVADGVIVDNRVPWERLLRQRIGSMYKPCVAERWDRLPTRLQGLVGRLVLPSQRMDRKRNGLHIMTALDASMSMTDEDIDKMRAIHASLPREYTLTITSFDTKCYLIESLDKIRGGGGTSITDVNRMAVEIEADCVVCLTDGFFSKPDLDRAEDWVFVVDGTDRNIPQKSTVFNM